MKALAALALAAGISCAAGSINAFAEDAKAPVAAAAAAKPSSPAQEAKLQDIKSLINLQNNAEAFNKVLDSTIEQMMKNMPPGQAEKMDAFFAEFRLELNIEAYLTKVSEGLIPVYDKNFTHDEIKQLIAFNQSPLGRKLIAALPEISAATMAAGQEISMEAARKAAAKSFGGGAGKNGPAAPMK